jgi:hypothetical protein
MRLPRHTILLAAAVFLKMTAAQAQTSPKAEVFCGAELFYADVNYLRLYDVRVNATPGVKVHLGKDWTVAGQLQVPIVNDGYAKRYDMIRLSMANVAKEFHFAKARQHFKLTAGLFGQERYGADLRWMYPVTSWLMFQARFGYTAHWALGFDFEGKSESKFESEGKTFATAGVNVWLDSWSTEFRASGGRYLNGDYGVEGEVLRHFTHCTVGLFLQRHERHYSYDDVPNRISGGFRVVMMIPPYKKSERKVVFRPASNFRLTYNAQADGYSMKKYMTDPEENERTPAIHIPWGTGNLNE